MSRVNSSERAIILRAEADGMLVNVRASDSRAKILEVDHCGFLALMAPNTEIIVTVEDQAGKYDKSVAYEFLEGNARIWSPGGFHTEN